MSTIAARLGGSKGTLWSYFSSKEDLFEAFIMRDAQPLTAAQRTALDPESDLRPALAGFCANLIRRVASPDGIALFRVVVSESIRFPEIGRIFWDGGPGRVNPMLIEYLSAQIARGKLRETEPEEMMNFLVSMCTGGPRMRMLLNLDQPGESDPQPEADAIVEAFLALYGAEAEHHQIANGRLREPFSSVRRRGSGTTRSS